MPVGLPNAVHPFNEETTKDPSAPRKPPLQAPTVRQNPFKYHTAVDTYEAIKITMVCLLGIPLLRLLLLLLICTIVVVVGNVAMVGHAPIHPQTKKKQHLARWRQWLIAPGPWLIRAALFVCGFYWISIRKPRRQSHETPPRLIVANHVTFIDGIFLASCSYPSIAMKEEVVRMPLFGTVLRALSPILINRQTSFGRKQAMKDIQEHLNDPTLPPLLVFPEGTTSNQDFLTKFKIGSFASGLACQPVVLKYPYKHFDLSWTPSVSATHLIWRMLCQVYNRLEVEFLPVYTPSDEEKKSPALYAENVRQLMAKALKIECANHAFEDVALLMNVGSYAEDHVIPIVPVGEITSLTTLRGAEVGQLVRFFASKDLNQDGQLSFEELTHLFPQDDKQLVYQLFTLLDVDGSGQIDFRELCLGLATLTTSHTAHPLEQLAFRLYDTDQNGWLDRMELDRMMQFTQSLYGLDPTWVHQALSEVEHSDGISFQAFERLVRKYPALLLYPQSRLERLRGSEPTVWII